MNYSIDVVLYYVALNRTADLQTRCSISHRGFIGNVDNLTSVYLYIAFIISQIVLGGKHMINTYIG